MRCSTKMSWNCYKIRTIQLLHFCELSFRQLLVFTANDGQIRLQSSGIFSYNVLGVSLHYFVGNYFVTTSHHLLRMDVCLSRCLTLFSHASHNNQDLNRNSTQFVMQLRHVRSSFRTRPHNVRHNPVTT